MKMLFQSKIMTIDPRYVQWYLICFPLFATFGFVNEIMAIAQKSCYADVHYA